MPSLDLSSVAAAAYMGARIDALGQAGKGDAYLRTGLKLDTPPFEVVQLNLANVQAHQMDLTSTFGGRSYISWQVSWPIGTRIIFDYVASPPIYSRTSAVKELTPAVSNIINYSSGPARINFQITSSNPFSYFGFVITAAPPRDLKIRNFQVLIPGT